MIPLFHLLPENEKFSAVMQSKTPKLMKALGNYIFTCLKKRGISTAANQKLHRDPKVLARIYGLCYDANLSVYTAALLNCF